MFFLYRDKEEVYVKISVLIDVLYEKKREFELLIN